jgi:hypothetical protein
LFILFNRDDYLRSPGESDEEDGTDGAAEAFIDPRLLIHSTLADGTTPPIESPVESLRSRQPSPKKSQPPRYHSLTHLSNRQPIVSTTRIHPNLGLQNLFGNLPFSNSVRTNNYPPSIQDAQVNNLFLPVWAMMPVNTRPDPGSVKHAFQALYRDTTALIDGGLPIDIIIEVHPNIAALFDEDEYNKSGVLSKWAAGMVHSAQLKGRFAHFVRIRQSIHTQALITIHRKRLHRFCFDVLHLVSCKMDDLTVPRHIRTHARVVQAHVRQQSRPNMRDHSHTLLYRPNQLFMPHISALDFVLWPAFREYAVQILEMQERMEWMLDMCNNLRCDWYFESQESFKTDEETGLLDLCDLAKVSRALLILRKRILLTASGFPKRFDELVTWTFI